MDNILKNYIVSFVTNFNDLDEIQLQKIKYGASIIIINLSKLLIIYFFAYILNIHKYVFVINLAFSFMRSSAYGVHAKKSIVCTLTMMSLFFGSTYLSICIKDINSFNNILFIISFILYYLYAPCGTSKNPLKNKLNRKKKKIKTLISLTIFYIITILIKQEIYINLIMLGVFFEALSVTPLAYKFFGDTNYK